jgi:hypothetical protein
MRRTRERSDPRQLLQLPLRFRVMSEERSDLIASETANISPCGLFMHTGVRLKVGTPLSLSLRIPTAISGSYRFYFQCTGRVIHEQQYVGGSQGYGVQFERALSAGQITRNAQEAGLVLGEDLLRKFVEKRRNQRQLVKVAVGVRSLEEGFPGYEVLAETSNISRHGAFLTSSIPLEIGSSVSLSLHMLKSWCGGGLGIKHSRARVIHEQSLADGAVGYGVEIESALPHVASLDSEEMETPIAWS